VARSRAVVVGAVVVAVALVVTGPVRVLVSGVVRTAFQHISVQRMSGSLAVRNCLWRYHDEKH